MANWTNEAEAREHIKSLVAEYYHDFKENKEPFIEIVFDYVQELAVTKRGKSKLIIQNAE